MYSSDVSRRSCWDIHVQYPKLVVFCRWESSKTCYFSIVLRTVLTKYKGFCTRLRTCGKSRSCKGYWNPRRKMGVATHFFEIITLESQQKCWHPHFSEKEGKDISSQISLDFAFTYRKSNAFIKILKLHGKW